MKRVLLITMMAFLLVGCAKADVNNSETQKPNSNVTESEDVSTEGIQDTEIVDTETDVTVSPYSFTEMDKLMYAKSTVNVRDLPSSDGTKLGELSWAQEVHVGGQCNETGWYRIEYNGGVAYVSNNYLVDTKPEASVSNTPSTPSTPSTPAGPTDPSQPRPDEIVTYGQWRFNRADTGGMEAEYKRLAEAGYGVIVDFTTLQGCGILVSTYDDATFEAAKEKLWAHVRALGYEPGVTSIGPLNGCLDDGVYLVSCKGYSVPYERPSDW